MIDESQERLGYFERRNVFTFPKKAVKTLGNESGDDLTITLSKTDAASIADAVSENFTLGLSGGTGDIDLR